MPGPIVAPYGSWSSPITSSLIVSGEIGFGQIALDGDDVYWVENRPAEAGRCVLVRLTLDGQTTDVTPPSFNVRTRVHEYGGGAFAVSKGTIYFSNFEDQRVYRQAGDDYPIPLTPETDMRYADGVVDHRRKRMVCVREDHSIAGREATNTLVSLDLEGCGPGDVLIRGNDFYSSPRLSPDGSYLAWLAWDHPNMPWDGSQLWVSELDCRGTPISTRQVAGGFEESIFQPEWSPNGDLYFVSDRTGWWNLYRWRGDQVEPVYQMEAEFGLPQWGFGMATYGFESARSIICAFNQRGVWRLARLDTRSQELNPIDTPYTEPSRGRLRVSPGRVVLGSGTPDEPASIVQLDTTTGQTRVLRRSSDVAIGKGYLSRPEALEFPTENGLTAHAWFYHPKNQDYTIPQGERPPLLVDSHGGPTGAASSVLDLDIQFWTSRGFAVLDVDYGGSTGYGTEYRRRLNGQWGVVDVDDCVNGAKYLVRRGDVDASRLAIRGGSAGGYTTLSLLTFTDVFHAGASYYGISDLAALTEETHKFESHYLDTLIGPYPLRRDLYEQRSPIYHTDRLSCPVIMFQGLEDRIVPPNQAEMMLEALRVKGLPVAYLPFEGEQHGFRRAENIKRALDAELYFYSRVFGFELADTVEPINIENMNRSRDEQ